MKSIFLGLAATISLVLQMLLSWVITAYMLHAMSAPTWVWVLFTIAVINSSVLRVIERVIEALWVSTEPKK